MRLLIIVGVFVTGCTTEIGGSGGQSAVPDANSTSGSGSDVGSTVPTDAGSASSMFPCKNLAAANGDGHHNPGQDCLNGCHNHGFTLAGTLYEAGGVTALAGGTVSVKDANGARFDMVAAQNGNFYTSQTIAFPISVYASSCPTSTPMTAAVVTGDGGCNKSGCHASGAQGHVHL
jgi:hypothetical protein